MALHLKDFTHKFGLDYTANAATVSKKQSVCEPVGMGHYQYPRGHILPKNRAKIRKCGKSRQIEDVIRSKNVVEIGVFYYWCPCVTLGDLGYRG